MQQGSATDYLGRKDSLSRSELLEGWKKEISPIQVERAHFILSAFGLDDVYDDAGYPTGRFPLAGG